MSSRIYPLYQRGNPQLRSFLTNFNMYPVRPSVKQPSNVVTFHCSMKMTIHDVKNYLTKIYQLPVDHVKMDIELGETRKAVPGNYVVKDDDTKVAYVTLGEGKTFKFPDLFPEEIADEDYKPNKDFEKVQEEYKKNTTIQEDRQHMPSWFGL